MADEVNTERRWIPRWITGDSTPDRLRLMAVVVVAVIVAAGATAWFLTDRLVSETSEVAESTGEVLVITQQLSASLAEADASAVSVHLAGAAGDREQRRLFEEAIDRAAVSVEQVSALVGDDEPSHQALQEIASRTTEYVGLIEAARFASINDFDSADATLEQAITLNQLEVSPEVEVLLGRATARFDNQIESNWYSIAIILLVVALVVVLAGLFWLNKRFRRLINVPLGLAAVVLIALIVVSSQSFVSQQGSFTIAERDAFRSIIVSQEIQETAYLHRALATSAVLQGAEVSDALAELEQRLEGPTGLLQNAEMVASSLRGQAGARAIATRWERYRLDSIQIQSALASGDFDQAEQMAQGSASSTFTGFNTSVEAALLDEREQFLDQLNQASDALNWLRPVILLGSLVAALLAWWGFAIRIGEYR